MTMERDSLVARLRHECAASNMHDHDGCVCSDEVLLRRHERTEAAAALSRPEQVVADEIVEHMVNRFLQWKLPEHFYPDCGITFDASYRSIHGPVGTNLFTAEQAKAMVRHMLEGLPSAAPLQADASAPASPAIGVQAVKALETCATKDCEQIATRRFERGDIGSYYCGQCFEKVLSALHPAPEAASAGAAVCVDCNGTGREQKPWMNGENCLVCGGTGSSPSASDTAPSPKGVSDGVREADTAAKAAFTALDVADRLIERAYGVDAPAEWTEEYQSVAKARHIETALSSKSVPSTAEERAASKEGA